MGGTIESEIRAIDAMKYGIKELLYLKKVFDSLSLSRYEMLIGFDSKLPVTIYEDNRATIQMTVTPMSHSSVKYLEADIAWIHDHISDGSIVLVYVNSSFNLANIDTKYLKLTEIRREVQMCMSDGVYELFPVRTTEEQSEDVKIAVINRNGYCPCCQKRKRLKPVIHTIPFTLASYQPMKRICVDAVGPINIDGQEYKHILVFIDAFSRYAKTYPLKIS